MFTRSFSEMEVMLRNLPSLSPVQTESIEAAELLVGVNCVFKLFRGVLNDHGNVIGKARLALSPSTCDANPRRRTSSTKAKDQGECGQACRTPLATVTTAAVIPPTLSNKRTCATMP